MSEVDAHKATRLELEREKWKSSESERRSAEAIGRMGDALSLMDEAVSRASMLEVKLEDATARATEAEVRASKLEARVGDAKSPAKSPRRGGEAEEGGRAERRAWHDARLKALDAEETAEAHRKRAEEAEAGLKALTGEISRMNLTIAEQQHALKVSQSECLELRLLREAMTIRDAEIARARVKEDEFRKRELEHNDEVERARGEGFAAAQVGKRPARRALESG